MGGASQLLSFPSLWLGSVPIPVEAGLQGCPYSPWACLWGPWASPEQEELTGMAAESTAKRCWVKGGFHETHCEHGDGIPAAWACRSVLKTQVVSLEHPDFWLLSEMRHWAAQGLLVSLARLPTPHDWAAGPAGLQALFQSQVSAWKTL